MKFEIRKMGIALCLLIFLGGLILHTYAGDSGFVCGHAWGNDDAFISFQYSRNLVRGNGLVFNPGEKVEGYSNFLYVLLMAPVVWAAGEGGVYWFAVFLNLLFALGAFWVFSSYLRRKLGEWNALAGSLLFALCLPIWIAVASGMETSLVLLLNLAIWVTVERLAELPDSRHVNRLCALSAVSLLVRADGFVVPGLAILFLLLKRRMRAAMLCGLAVVATFGAYEVWRYHYYGYLLPNTYYVKVAGPLGGRLIHALDQLGKVSFVTGLLAYLLVYLFASLDLGKRVARGQSRILDELRFDILLAWGWIAYWFYIGGDHFLERFLLLLYPLGIFAMLKYLEGHASPKTMAWLVAFLAILQVGPSLEVDRRFDYTFHKYDCWVTLGKFLGAQYPHRTLATDAIGKIPFFSGLYTVDMLGLIDPVIAHRRVSTKEFDPGHVKFDPDYLLARKPDLIADWIGSSLDMAYGLTRPKYQTAGYRIAYLVRTERAHPFGDIVEVSGFDENALRDLVNGGYKYAVLMRK